MYFFSLHFSLFCFPFSFLVTITLTFFFFMSHPEVINCLFLMISFSCFVSQNLLRTYSFSMIPKVYVAFFSPKTHIFVASYFGFICLFIVQIQNNTGSISTPFWNQGGLSLKMTYKFSCSTYLYLGLIIIGAPSFLPILSILLYCQPVRLVPQPRSLQFSQYFTTHRHIFLQVTAKCCCCCFGQFYFLYFMHVDRVILFFSYFFIMYVFV